MIGVHRGEGVVAAKVRERCADGIGQIARVVLLDQVGDDLGVGLGREDVAVLAQLGAKLGVVLDDPVEDDVDGIRAVAVRMGVLLGHAAVRGPAGVGEADRGRRGSYGNAAVALGPIVGRNGIAQVREVSDCADRVDVPVFEQGDPRRVIAAVLQLLEPLDEEVTARPLPHVADDAAHGPKG